MRSVLAPFLLLLVVLPLTAQDRAAEVVELSGVGFALRGGETTADIEALPFMIRLSVRVANQGANDDSSVTESWLVDFAAMRLGFTTYFLDVLTMDSESIIAYVQPVTVNEYGQTILGDRIGELELENTLLLGLAGGDGSLGLDGETYRVFYYTTDVTNTFTRWVEMLE